MQHLLAPEQAVERDVREAGGLADALPGREHPQVPLAQPAVNGFFQHPYRAPLDQFFFQHA